VIAVIHGRTLLALSDSVNRQHAGLEVRRLAVRLARCTPAHR
jgi:hypothetical protein